MSDVGELLWVGFHGTRAPAPLLHDLEHGAIGATILFKRNLEFDDGGCDLRAVEALTRSLHRGGALIAIDQEGGTVQRVRAPATVWPVMRRFDHVDGDAEGLAEAVGRALGGELRALGVDVDFAPVLDVHTNPANPVIGDRAFGIEPEVVARRALAFARGLDVAGVVACGKHFPGHGDTETDSHLELPRIDHAWDRLERVELLPFARAAAAGIPMIMTAHVVFAAIDAARPATLSRDVIHGVLRERLGFGGVIVSDDLDMKAISDDVGGAAVAAIAAGCDVLLVCQSDASIATARAALTKEHEASSAFRARVGEAAARMRALKRAHATNLAGRPPLPFASIGCAEHQQLARRLTG
jgi:beta-N-acetylhexosaminidase